MKHSSPKGFTLLEILLAISILGVALTVIMQQFSAGLRIGHTSRTYTTATAYAKQKLEEFQLEEEMEEGEEAGDFEDGYTNTFPSKCTVWSQLSPGWRVRKKRAYPSLHSKQSKRRKDYKILILRISDFGEQTF
jgi:prepilin-type N-terminal cleavage/methylation domain-containing protein